mgnify:CR=1 FL=1
MEIDRNEIQSIIDVKIKDGVKKFGKDFKFFVLEIISLEKMLAPEPTETQYPKLIPLTKWNEHFPDPSVKALRMLVFRKDTDINTLVIPESVDSFGSDTIENPDEILWMDDIKAILSGEKEHNKSLRDLLV